MSTTEITKICKRCKKFPVYGSVHQIRLCRFCATDYKKSLRLFGSDFNFAPGAKRKWIGKYPCPIDLHLV